MSHWYTISIDFEAADINDADHRHDEAVDALCGCEPGLHGSCINFVSSMRPATKEKDKKFLDGPVNPEHPYTPTPSQESTTGLVDTPLREEVEQFVGRLARHLPDDDGNVEDADEAPGITDITTELMRILLTTEEDRWVLDGDAFAKAVDAKAADKIEKARKRMQSKTQKAKENMDHQVREYERRRSRGTSAMRRKFLRRHRRRHIRRALIAGLVICIFLGLLWLN